MKSKILSTVVLILIILTVDYALFSWNENIKAKAATEQVTKMYQDSLTVLLQRDSLLVSQIDSLENRIALTSDSIKLYKAGAIKTKKRYEKILNGMFSWTTDKHVWFFSVTTSPIK